MNLNIGEPILVYAPEMKGNVEKWGVYAIPRMWRAKNGELVIRLNGEVDCADINEKNCLEHLYFVSNDNGDTWQLDKDGENKYDTSIITGIDPPFLPLENGEKVFFKSKKNCAPIKNVAHKKEFVFPSGSSKMRAYCYGDIPNEAKGIYFGKIDSTGFETLTEIDFDFSDREVLANYKASTSDGYIEIDQYIAPYIWSSPYMSALNILSDGTFVALSTGQHPEVDDHFCSEIYLVASTDGGKTWRKRGTVATTKDELPYGYGGDGGEVSLTIAKDGSLHCVMRMDLSIHPDKDKHKIWGTYYTSSFDGGFTWSKPREIADSSVTPHIVALEDTLLLIYGRPGVHIKYSNDNGKTWSESISIIGKTLQEERALGRGDFESKYGDSISYSNTFYERISANEIILLYNNQKYPDKNGVNTKAVFVRKIKV